MAKERIKVIREEMLQVANNVSQEKNIDKDAVFSAMEQALEKAARVKYGMERDIRVTINRDTGDIKLNSYLEVVEKLLLSISSRGIYDHLEGGVSRYTVDEKWIVPHFEKMLYDNIQYVNLLNNYLNLKENNYLKNKLKQTINFIN